MKLNIVPKGPISVGKGDCKLILLFPYHGQIFNFWDPRLVTTIRWNGGKEHCERQVDSAKCFNGHL